MGLELENLDGQTPLDEDEKEGLLIQTIATREELDEFEQQNIEDAILWVLNRSLKAESIVTETFIRSLHNRMFGGVWDWAGKYRKTRKNLGVDPIQIPVELKKLCEDMRYWLTHETFSPEETALRFKHRLVSIHCFSNGNGRHSRLMADVIISKIYGLPEFSWGSSDLTHQGQARDEYLQAVNAADKGNFEPMIQFARS